MMAKHMKNGKEERDLINDKKTEAEQILKKESDNATVKAEYEAYVEQLTDLDAKLSDILSDQKEKSMKKEIVYFKFFGIKAVYQDGYLIADLTKNQIEKISFSRYRYSVYMEYEYPKNYMYERNH